MKTTRRVLALAIAIAIGLSSAYAEPTGTNAWWSVDFEDYTVGDPIAGVTSAEGTWSNTESDASTVFDGEIDAHTSKMGKLNTENGTLVWTPAQAGAPASLTKVLIDTYVYMIGSEDAPASSLGTVQTEVFLTNSIAGETTTSYLCAHVGDETGTGTNWVQLSGVTVTDQSWINLRIEIDYATAPPKVRFIVGSTTMTDGADEWFYVMPSGKDQTTVTDVTFMGTGYFDNFVGRRVGPLPPGPTFEGSINTDGTSGAVVPNSITEDEGKVTAAFASGTKYIRMTGPDGFVRTERVDSGTATFSTDGLPAGTYSIVAYYGAAPTVIPSGYTPEAEASEGKKAAQVAGGQITINVVPVSGLYYTLFAGETVAGLKATATSTVATPADEDAGFLQIAMPVPTEANEVKIIKIVASDDPYALGAAIQ